MKARHRLQTTTLVAALVAALLQLVANSAWAYYNPQVGRWLNRDLLKEEGFRAYAARDFFVGLKLFAQLENDLSPYGFVAGDSVNRTDHLGLAVPKPPAKKPPPPPTPPRRNPCGNDPVRCMTCMAWAEGRPNDACMKAIAQVIWNRAQEQNKNMCEIVSAAGQFNAYNPRPNERGNVNIGYSECCRGTCKSPAEDARLKQFQDTARGWPEEFGGGDTQLGGATYFHDNSISLPSDWGDKSTFEEIPVPGCSMHFYRKAN